MHGFKCSRLPQITQLRVNKGPSLWNLFAEAAAENTGCSSSNRSLETDADAPLLPVSS